MSVTAFRLRKGRSVGLDACASTLEALFGSRASVRELSVRSSDAEVLSNATRHIGGRPLPVSASSRLAASPTGDSPIPQVARRLRPRATTLRLLIQEWNPERAPCSRKLSAPQSTVCQGRRCLRRLRCAQGYARAVAIGPGLRGARVRRRGGRLEERCPGRARTGSRRRLLRDQPGLPLGREGGALREPAERLLAPAPRGGLHAEARRPVRAGRRARVRHRDHERRAPDDQGLVGPPEDRLRGQRGAARAVRPRARAAGDRLRRQGGLPRPLRRAARARPTGAAARRDRCSSSCRRRRRRTPPCPGTSGSTGSGRCASSSRERLRIRRGRARDPARRRGSRAADALLVRRRRRLDHRRRRRRARARRTPRPPGASSLEEAGLEVADGRRLRVDARARVSATRSRSTSSASGTSSSAPVLRADAAAQLGGARGRGDDRRSAGGRSTRSSRPPRRASAPRPLGTLLQELLRDGPPAEPLDVGV